MEKETALLAAMQVKHKYYSISTDKNDICRDIESEELVTAKNEHLFQRDTITWWVKGQNDNIISDDPRIVASHDQEGLVKIFVRKMAKKEKNYAYYIYHPAYEILTDKNGNIIYEDDGVTPKKACTPKYVNAKLNAKRAYEGAELDIGTFETMKDHVFYWNLVDQFIPYYYGEYLPEEGDPERSKRIEEIAEQIYILYDAYGPSQECRSAKLKNVKFGDSDLCLNGVTVKNTDGSTENVPLEEYVAGVVQGELGGYLNSIGIEAAKAQAVAARTYVLYTTSNCSSTILNSSANQNYTKPTNQIAIEAATSTAGELLYNNGQIFLSEYDSWYCKKSDTCTYTKLPLGETNELTLSSYNSWAAGGHGRGMSQIRAFQYADEGLGYQEILAQFYSSGTTVVQASQNNSGVTYGVSGTLGEPVEGWQGWKQSAQPWGSMYLGNSQSDMANWGCFVTSYAMAFAKFGLTEINGEPLDPGVFLSYLNQYHNEHPDAGTFGAGGGFDNPIPALRQLVSTFNRTVEFNDVSIENIKNNLDAGNVVIIGISHYGSKGVSSHFFVAYDHSGDTIYIADPGGWLTTYNDYLKDSSYISTNSLIILSI